MTPGLIFAPGESGRYWVRTSDLCNVISSPDETKPTELIPFKNKKSRIAPGFTFAPGEMGGTGFEPVTSAASSLPQKKLNQLSLFP